MTRLTASSPTVTPYSASAASIVPRLWVMTTNWMSSARQRSADAEAPHVRLVERRVDLVEHAERHRADLEHRQQQGDRGERALAAREHRERLALLAGRARRDLDAGRREVVRLGQRQLRLPSPEQLLEATREGTLERRERLAGTARS